MKIKLLIKIFLLFMPFRFSNDLFALKKCHILHFENLTSSKKLGIKLLMNIVLISDMLHTFLKYEIKYWGQWWKLRDIGQNIQILVIKQGWFLFRLLYFMSTFSQKFFVKSIGIVLKYYLNPVSNISSA